MTALVNGTYTFSSVIGNDTFYLHFRESASGSPLRGRPYSGSASFHWEIGTTRFPNRYTLRNSLYQMQVTFPGAVEEGKVMESGNAPQDWYIIPAERGYIVSVDPGRSLVWNIAGGQTVDHAHIIFYEHSDLADNELWNIRPVELAPDVSSTSSSVGAAQTTPGSTSDAPSTSDDASTSRPIASSRGEVLTVSGSVSGSASSPQNSAPSETDDDSGSAFSFSRGGNKKLFGAIGIGMVLPILLSAF